MHVGGDSVRLAGIFWVHLNVKKNPHRHLSPRRRTQGTRPCCRTCWRCSGRSPSCKARTDPGRSRRPSWGARRCRAGAPWADGTQLRRSHRGALTSLFFCFFLGFEHHFWDNVTLHVTAENNKWHPKAIQVGGKHFFADTFLPESLEEAGWEPLVSHKWGKMERWRITNRKLPFVSLVKPKFNTRVLLLSFYPTKTTAITL